MRHSSLSPSQLTLPLPTHSVPLKSVFMFSSTWLGLMCRRVLCRFDRTSGVMQKTMRHSALYGCSFNISSHRSMCGRVRAWYTSVCWRGGGRGKEGRRERERVKERAREVEAGLPSTLSRRCAVLAGCRVAEGLLQTFASQQTPPLHK